MKLRYELLLLFMFVLCLSGCDHGRTEHLPTPTPTQVLETTSTPKPTATLGPTETPRPTRKLTQEQQFELEKKQREEERLALLASPTPGPEPYGLLEAERKIMTGDVVIFGEYCHGQNPEYSYQLKFF